MEHFLYGLILLVVAGGIISLLFTVVNLVQENLKPKQKLNTIEEKEFQKVIISDDLDLKILGSYLDEVLGKITMYEFSTNPQIADKFDQYLKRIQEFESTTNEDSEL